MGSTITVDISDRIATITLNRPASLNAITTDDYDAFANALREIDKNEDVLITVWQATGKWFCAGTDVKRSGNNPADSIGSVRKALKNNVVSTTTDCGKALYSHSKILVAALNGPVMAFLGYFDFIYALPSVWLAVPFTFLGIVAEGGASVSFVNRMGVAVANEVLIWGKKKTADELLACGFLNKIFPNQSAESFHAEVRKLLLDELSGLDPTALLVMRSLIRRGLHEKNDPDAVNLRESYAQAERFASGIPALQFSRIARKEIKHKL
ncbi:3,2-trans-enoyl-CoA isomerase [Psilocybe cubensis]|uniref:3,2-trans-enoyl-CoA isomerase n=2 Tax=Psilocybe cubensis TaxID=181762 RepID=A0ACB8GKT2_PSICU|nr:3,2-trans-enoyl-CoA isomerase [Psilocybe cubensis]KAH9475997.1 3,2-trans-enoyl-CoA isomerase [Psilocybe cubensis]